MCIQCVYIYIHIHTYVYIHIHTYMHVYIGMYRILKYISIYVYMNIWIYVYMYIHVYIFHIHISIHVYIRYTYILIYFYTYIQIPMYTNVYTVYACIHSYVPCFVWFVVYLMVLLLFACINIHDVLMEESVDNEMAKGSDCLLETNCWLHLIYWCLRALLLHVPWLLPSTPRCCWFWVPLLCYIFRCWELNYRLSRMQSSGVSMMPFCHYTQLVVAADCRLYFSSTWTSRDKWPSRDWSSRDWPSRDWPSRDWPSRDSRRCVRSVLLTPHPKFRHPLICPLLPETFCASLRAKSQKLVSQKLKIPHLRLETIF